MRVQVKFWPAFLCLLLAQEFTCSNCRGVELVTLNTTKTNFFVGERLDYTIRFTPPGIAFFNSTPFHTYIVDSNHVPISTGLQVMTTVTQPVAWTNSLNWQKHPLSPGDHSMRGVVRDYGTSAPVTFHITAPAIPTGDFKIDCARIIGTTNILGDLIAYEFQGVTFRTRQGNLCGFFPPPYGISGQDPAPDKCNVVAHFAMPVFGVKAKVGFGGSSNLTATAKNSAGQILATVVSATNNQTAQFISLRTLEPIASVEWRPNGQETSYIAVNVLELEVATGPVLHHRHTGTYLDLYWPTVPAGRYQLWSSTNLLNWIVVGDVQDGAGQPLTNSVTIGPELHANFFRVIKAN